MRIDFVDTLKKLQDQDKSAIPLAQHLIYENLFKRISPDDFQKLLNHAIKNYDQYKIKSYHYAKKSPEGANINAPNYLPCTYEIYRQSNGDLMLIIQTKSKSAEKTVNSEGLLVKREKLNDIKKIGGSFKKGGLSFGFNDSNLTEYFTLTSRGRLTQELLHEKEIIAKINSPFIQQCLFGEERTDEKGLKKMSVSAPKLKDNLEFSILEDLLVGIKSFACGLKDIHNAGIVHNDLKTRNLLLGPNGIIKIIDFGLSVDTREEKKGTIGFTPKYLAPEGLASLIEQQWQTKQHLGQLDLVTNNFIRHSYLKGNLYQVIKLLYMPQHNHYRYDFHLVANLEDNIYSAHILQYWLSEGQLKLQDHNPHFSHDMWAFGRTLYEFFNIYVPTIDENQLITQLKELIKQTILSPALDKRSDINLFIKNLEDLILSYDPAITDRVNARIELHKKQFSELNPKISDEKEGKPALPQENPAKIDDIKPEMEQAQSDSPKPVKKQAPSDLYKPIEEKQLKSRMEKTQLDSKVMTQPIELRPLASTPPTQLKLDQAASKNKNVFFTPKNLRNERIYEGLKPIL